MSRIFKSKIWIIIILLIVFFIVFNLTGFSKGIKNFFYSFSSSLQESFWEAGNSASYFFSGILEVKILKKEIEEAYLKNKGLLSEITFLKDLKEENQSLREALDINLAKEFQIKVAQLVNKDTFQDSILINKGSENGILSGFPVISSKKILVGRIGQVYNNFSEVVLISNKESSFDARVSEKDVYGVIKGGGSLKLSLSLIPKEKEINVGELIVTTTLGGIFPRGLLVGEIKEIKISDLEPFKEAIIIPSFNIKKSDNFFVIINF